MAKFDAVVEDVLQQTLVDLIDLELQAKQAHWNIQGSRFRSLHLALDELVDYAREELDEVAERIATIGGTPDGRSETVAKTTSLDPIDGGVLDVDKAYSQMADKIQAVCDKIRENLDKVDEADPISGDLLISATAGLEKQAWFLRSAAQ